VVTQIATYYISRREDHHDCLIARWNGNPLFRMNRRNPTGVDDVDDVHERGIHVLSRNVLTY